MVNCLVKKIKSVIDNSSLSTLEAITLHVNATVKETLTVLSKGRGMTVSCTGGNYLSLSPDGSNPTNNISITTYTQTVVYLLPGEYNVLCKGLLNLDILYWDSDASNDSSIILDDLNNSKKVTSLRVKNAKIKGNIGSISYLKYIVGLNFFNTGYALTGSVEVLCKNIIEEGERITIGGLRFEADNLSNLYIMDSVKFPGDRVVNIAFDLANHAFTMTESTLNINRTYTLSGGTWSYVDN